MEENCLLVWRYCYKSRVFSEQTVGGISKILSHLSGLDTVLKGFVDVGTVELLRGEDGWRSGLELNSTVGM